MSQSADLLALLSDGQPHEMRAIHRAIGFCRLNSRVSELRGRGYGIECDKTGGQYVYTLVSRPLEAGTDWTTVSASSGCGSDVLPTHEAPRVEASVTAVSPQPLTKSEATGIWSSLDAVTSGRGTDGKTQSSTVASDPFIEPDGQLRIAA